MEEADGIVQSIRTAYLDEIARRDADGKTTKERNKNIKTLVNMF